MNGNCATFRSCWRAASSSGTPFVQALMGTPFSVFITLYVASVIVSSFLELCSQPIIWSGRGDSNSRSRAPEARAFNQARPLPEVWWLVTELNRVHRLFRPALYRRVHEPKSGGRCETRTRISRVQAVDDPLIRTAHKPL